MLKTTTFLASIAISMSLCILAPPSSPAGEKASRIAYVETGKYWTYSETYNAIKEYLKKHSKNKIEYPSIAHISPGWDQKAKLKEAVQTLMDRTDIDVIITAGTAATAAALEMNNNKTPIFAISVADAVRSKFVINAHDSGVDNFTVRIVPNRYTMMFEAFYEVVGFRKLGIMYPNTKEGRTYANIKDAKQVSREIGFEVVKYDKIGDAESTQDCFAGLEYLLSQDIDAFFIPPLNCFNENSSGTFLLLDLLKQHKIPTFAREGHQIVEIGALMGFSPQNFENRGEILGERLIKILNGAQPRSLTMIDKSIPEISYNLKIASDIEFDSPMEVLSASDTIYLTTDLP